ncbi:MAG: SIS domain-containing protein [Ruminococcaceae bacterium]|nr:SIS domain-containing protein [Oscillospiraceae bacterium]
MNKADYNNSMRLESYDLATFARKLYELNIDEIDSITPKDFLTAERVIATGCGDSFCAAWAAQTAFEKLVGIPAFSAPAIDVSRQFDGRDFDNTLFFGISSRGRTSRVIEAAMRVKALGAKSRTIAIVNFKVKDSQLERETDKSLHIRMPVFECGEYTEHAPCQRSYFSTMFTLMMIAIRMGNIRGRYNESRTERIREEVIKYAERFDRKFVDSVDDRMWEISKIWNNYRQWEVVASGIDYPTGWFGAAKVVEAFGDIATYENIDNWNRVNRYAKNPEKIATILFASTDNGRIEDAVETVETMVRIGRPVIVITDAKEGLFNSSAEVFRIPTTELIWAKPLMQYMPLGNLLGYITKMRGVSFYRYGGDNNWYIKELQDKLGDAITEQPLVLVK